MQKKKARQQQKEMTFQDMYNNQGLFDEDDDEDSDWEPAQEHVEVVKWFCNNCTMVNLDDVLHCDVCLFFISSFFLAIVIRFLYFFLWMKGMFGC